ncbi:MAG: CaiB/BaiF CoA transferase family protein [Acidimicrobiia bacterium]
MLQLLAGVRVIDLTTVVLGPYATAILGDLGADVVKVEPPGGDLYRAGPPARHPGMGAPFLTINRNKRSIALDLTRPEATPILSALVDGADVVIHNMLPRVSTKLGVDAATLTRDRPRLIHVTTPGFGSNGPDRDLPAYDDVIQGRMGLASLLADDSGVPRLAPTTLADKVTGLHAAIAVLAALRHRDVTGRGSIVEVPMLETMASFLLAEHMGGRAFDPPLGSPGYNRLLSPHRRPHRTADGYIVLLPYSDRHWASLIELIEDPEWRAAEWVFDRTQRAERIDELYALLGQLMSTRSSAEWLDILAARDIPAGPVASLDDLFRDPHLQEVGFFSHGEHPSEGPVVTTASPIRADGETDTDRPAPRLGEHGREVLAELGYDDHQIQSLVEAGVVVVG